LDLAEGALQDPRKFFLTNNLRFVKKVLSSSKLSALMKKYGNPKNHTFRVYISQFDTYFVIICTVLWYKCFGSSRRCSAGSKKNFLNKQSETCQKGFELQQTLSSYEKMEIQKISHLVYISLILYDYMTFRTIYGYQCFGSSRRSSAGSKKNFLDKQSEICQKSLELQQTLSSCEQTCKSRKPYILCVYLSFLRILWYF